MKTFSEFSNASISYEIYEDIIDEVFLGINLNENKLSKIDPLIKKSMGKTKAFFDDFKTYIMPEIEAMGGSVEELVTGLKSKNVFALLKFFGFSLKQLLKVTSDAGDFYRKNLTSVFENIHNTKAIQKIKNGTMTVDQLMDKHPILKKVTGPMVAGLLIYVWFNKTALDNLSQEDVDFSSMINALKGSYSLEDLFGSPEGLMMLSLFTSSLMTGKIISSASKNILKVLVFVILRYSKAKNKKPRKKLKIQFV